MQLRFATLEDAKKAILKENNPENESSFFIGYRLNPFIECELIKAEKLIVRQKAILNSGKTYLMNNIAQVIGELEELSDFKFSIVFEKDRFFIVHKNHRATLDECFSLIIQTGSFLLKDFIQRTN